MPKVAIYKDYGFILLQNKVGLPWKAFDIKAITETSVKNELSEFDFGLGVL
jgi:hypothetical protein